MLTLNMTAGDDNTAIFVYEIILDTGSIKLATRSITLSSNVWNGAVIKHDTPSDIEQSISIVQGGSISQVGNFGFSISNWSGTFIDDFFPTNTKPYIYGRIARVGIVWSTATTEAEITWLCVGVIQEYSYTPSDLTIVCMEAKDIDAKIIPPYSIQKTDVNLATYFGLAPRENIDVPIPVVYGDLTTWTGKEGRYALAPAVLVNPDNLTWVIACHELHTESKSGSDYYIYYVDNGTSDVIRWENTATGSTTGNTAYGVSTLQMYNLRGLITGQVYMQFDEGSAVTTAAGTSDNAFDDDFTNYMNVDSGEIVGMRVGGNTSQNDFGTIGQGVPIEITFLMSSNNANARNVEINYQDPSGVNGAGTTVSVSGTTLTEYKWAFTYSGAEIDFLLSNQFWMQNDDPDTGDLVRLANGFIYIKDIVYPGMTKPKPKYQAKKESATKRFWKFFSNPFG